MSEGMTLPPDPAQARPPEEPKRIKVFGILHIVFGGMGLIYTVIGFATLMFRGQLEKLSAGGQPEELTQVQKELSEATGNSDWVGVGLGAIVSVLILIAGIALVRRKRNSPALNTFYACVSLLAKVVSILIFIVVVVPALNDIAARFEGQVSSEVETMISFFKLGMIAMGTLVPIVAAFYPALALIMLNRPVVKDYLAKYGT